MQLPSVTEWQQTDTGMNITIGGHLLEVMSEDDDLWHGYVDGRSVGAKTTPEETARFCAEAII